MIVTLELLFFLLYDILYMEVYMKYCMIEIAFDNEEEVNETINMLLKNRLVSGCQVVESNSKWRWKDKIEMSKEYLVFLKTKKDFLKEIYDVVRKIHNYECFEFATFDLDSYNQEYLNWIDEETK